MDQIDNHLFDLKQKKDEVTRMMMSYKFALDEINTKPELFIPRT